MKKTLAAIIILIVILLGGYYWIRMNSGQKPAISSVSVATSTGIDTSSLAPIYKISDLFAGESFSQPFSITNSSTDAVISFKNFKTSNSSNGLASVYLNGRLITNGQVGGVVLAESSFSPDNKYFGMLFNQESGATNYSFEFSVINLISPTSSIITVPLNMPQTYSGDTSRFAIDSITLRPVSFTWNADDTLNITTYFMGTIYDKQANTVNFYQISPAQIWNYNLSTGNYVLVQTLSESSSTN